MKTKNKKLKQKTYDLLCPHCGMCKRNIRIAELEAKNEKLKELLKRCHTRLMKGYYPGVYGDLLTDIEKVLLEQEAKPVTSYADLLAIGSIPYANFVQTTDIVASSGWTNP